MSVPQQLILIAAVALPIVLGVSLWLALREVVRLRALLAAASARLERLQLAFDHFAPPAIVERIIEAGIPAAGQRIEVTALFADLVGFTTLAEGTPPAKLVEIMNGYFECMSRAITAHHGHVATFIGDGLLALFGAFEPNPWQGNDSVDAALEMRAELAGYNQELQDKGLPTLALGIGLHRGTGIAGLVGSGVKKEFTIIGRTINIAARLQTLTREHAADILLSEDLQRTLDPRFVLTKVGPVALRGVHEPITVFAVQGQVADSAR